MHCDSLQEQPATLLLNFAGGWAGAVGSSGSSSYMALAGARLVASA
jgi:hypothetical protein